MTGATSAAIIGAGVVGAGASIYSANKAASAQKQATNNAINAQEGFFNTTQQNLQPFIQTGEAAGNKISSLEGLGPGGPSNIQATLNTLPGYQFANTQGLKSTQNSATARGLGVSGAAQKGAAAYSTGLANEYYNNLLTGLQNTQTTGANAAAGLGTAATQTGSNIGSNLTGLGQAQAGAAIAQGNAVSNLGTTGVTNALLVPAVLQNLQNPQNAGQSNFLANVQNSFTDANNIYGNSLNTGGEVANTYGIAP